MAAFSLAIRREVWIVECKIEGARNSVSCLLEESLWPRPAIVQAAYHFIDRCYVKLERAGAKKITVRLKGKKKLSARRLTELADEFGNELLHQLMREQLSRRASRLREIILERALMSAQPAGEDGEGPGEGTAVSADADYLDDPLGIAVPWEEKYGESKDEK
jgi:His-Xaa-Ser system protein HxsD